MSANRWIIVALLTAGIHALPSHAQKEKRRMAPIPASARPSSKTAHSTAEGGLHAKPKTDTLPDLQAMQVNGVKASVAHTAAAGKPMRQGHWLLLYRREICVPCDTLQNALAASSSPALDGGRPYVIVVANNGDTHGGNRLDALRARYASMSNATWMEDSKGAVIAALQPRGTPMLYAMSGNRIAWRLPGSLGNPAMVEHMASSWLASSDPVIGSPADPAALPSANSPTPTTASTPGKTSPQGGGRKKPVTATH